MSPGTARRNARRLVLCALLASLCACKPAPVATGADAADIVYTDGGVYTVDPVHPWAQALAVKGNTIVFVGSNAEARAYVGAGTRQVSLKGHMLLPGFIDSHVHPLGAGLFADACMLEPEWSRERVLEEIGKFARAHADRGLILGVGFRALAFGPQGPTAAELDRLIPDRPAVFLDEGAHSAWINSRILQDLHLDRNTPDAAPGASYFQRDASGRPTGWLLEAQTFQPVIAHYQSYATEHFAEKSADLFRLFSHHGVTTVFEAGMFGLEDWGFATLEAMHQAGTLPFRVMGSYIVTGPAQIPTAVARLQALHQRYDSDFVRAGTLKIQGDGTIEARTAALTGDYTDTPGRAGALFFTQEQLDALVTQADAAGFAVHIHAIGNRMSHAALDAFAAARKANGVHGPTHAMAHAQLLSDADLERFASLNVVLQTTPQWFHDSPETRAAIGAERYERLSYRVHAAQAQGAHLAFGSDYPATGTDILTALGVLTGMEMGITRRAPTETPAVPALPTPGEALRLEDMIRGYTADGAYQLGMSARLGSLEKGKLADLVVLDHNLFEVPVPEIHEVKVLETVLDGKPVFERGLRAWLTELYLRYLDE